MLSEADPNSSVEPWFALSKDRYWTILNEALSEMEPREPEGLVQAELPNCTELIKLLNQDDGLGNSPTTGGAAALLAPPTDARASGVRPAPNRPPCCDGKATRSGGAQQAIRSPGYQSFPGGTKRKRMTSGKGNSFGSLCKSLRKGSEGAQPRVGVNGKISVSGVVESSATAQPRRTLAIGRGKDSIKEHEETLGRRRGSFESGNPTSADPETNCEYPLRFPEAFSPLRFHDIGRRPSDGRYFQGHRSSPGGGSAVAIPSRDLSRSKVVPIVKAKEEEEEEGRWSRPVAFPSCALSASAQGVKVEPKDEFSTISGKKKIPEQQSIIRSPSCNVDGRSNIPPTTTATTTAATPTGRSDRNDSSAAAEVTSRQPPTSGGGGGVGVDFVVGVAPFVELLKTDQSAVGLRCAPRRTNPGPRDTATATAATAPPIRVIPCRIRVAVEDRFKHSHPPTSCSTSRPNGRNPVSGPIYPSSDGADDRRGVLPVAPPGGENALRRDEESGASCPSDFLRGTFERQRRPDRGGARSSQKRGSTSSRRERQLWAAFDKSMVNSMMQQILDEEDAVRQRLKLTHLDENEEVEEEEEVEVEEDHLCPNRLVTEVAPVTRTKFPPGDISSLVLSREANTTDHDIASVESDTENASVRSRVNGIPKSPVSSQEFARDLRIKSKSLSASKNPDIAGSGSSSSSSSSSSRHVPDTAATRVPTLSLVGETGSGETFNAQKLGMSRMSFKWKSKMLNRLRKDQITASKWCMSETLSA